MSGSRLSHLPILSLLLAGEIVVFSAIGTNFRTVENAFEIVRLVVEIGLLALALTPVIVTGGIDLSVGSLMGLSAVLLGTMWRDLGLSVWLAAPPPVFAAALAAALHARVLPPVRITALC